MIISHGETVPASELPLEKNRSAYEAALRDWEKSADIALLNAVSVPDAMDRCAGLIQLEEGEPTSVRAAKAAYRGTMIMVLQYAFARYRRLPKSERAEFDAVALPLLQKEAARMKSVMHQALKASFSLKV